MDKQMNSPLVQAWAFDKPPGLCPFAAAALGLLLELSLDKVVLVLTQQICRRWSTTIMQGKASGMDHSLHLPCRASQHLTPCSLLHYI